MVHLQHFFRVLISGFALFGLAVSALAVEAPDQIELTSKNRVQILSEAADAIETNYLDVAKGKEISSALRSRIPRSRLRFESPITFARETTSYLFEISGDKHLAMKWNPANSGRVAGSAPASSDHGIKTVRFLPGNIGLMRIDQFYEDHASRDSLIAALFLMRSSDALIFDFRENRGGASNAVRLLQSCFFSEPVLTMYYEDKPGERIPSMSEAPQDNINCQNKPFYMLTSSLTASAAEDFIYTADLENLGIIIGETTAGAANFVDHTNLSLGFRLSISVGRPVHPDTGTNWEGAGIKPNIETPPAKALDHANFEALQLLHDKASGRDKSRLLFSLNLARARVIPVQLSNRKLRAFVGRYGSMRVTLTSDGLFLRADDGTSGKFEPLSANVFQMEGKDAPQAIFEKREDGATFLELLYKDGNREEFGK